MVSLFEKSERVKGTRPTKPMALSHEEFLSRIKKSFYLGPSNPNKMISNPAAEYCSKIFTDVHHNFSLSHLSMENISRIRQQTPSSLILSLVYLDRLRKSDPTFVKLITPSELFLVTLMVSAKFYNDYDEVDVFASSWAKEGDMDVERLKQIEILFLNAINWNVLVSKNEFYAKLRTVEKILALKEGLARGWLTYTEMDRLMPSTEIIKLILNYARVIVFSYVCSIAAIALSGVILTCAIRANHAAVTPPQFNNATSLHPLPPVDIDAECDDNNTGSFDEIRQNYSSDFIITNEFAWDVKQHVTSYVVTRPKSIESVPLMMRLTTGWNG